MSRPLLPLVLIALTASTPLVAQHTTLPLIFEANHGQAAPDVQFIGRGSGYDVLVGKDGATVRAPGRPEIRLVPLGDHDRPYGQEPLDVSVNYVLGSDPRRWALAVPVFARVVQPTQPGVRLEYYSRDGRLEFDYLVSPGADPAQIRVRIEGATPRLTGNGDLALRAGSAELVVRAPRAYQVISAGAREIASRYVVRNDEVSFALGDYDRRLPLVIDPELVYGSYVGGSSVEAARAIAVNGSGYAHVTGWTLSGDFPVVHAADGINADVFLVKLDPTGRQVVYATYFGGSGDDRANAIALDATGNVYITGMTASTDLPVSSNAVQKEVRGIDAFVAKFGPTGTLLYATYMGGTMAEQGQGIAVNQAGEAYITGYTNSDDYPTTTGAFQIACVGCGGYLGFADAFVTRLNANGSGLIYSTYLSGNIFDYGQGIALDAVGNAHVIGFTASDFFPVVNPVQATRKGYQGRSDAFVSKLNAAGTALIYSTYLGSFQDDFGYAIAVDSAGNAYAAGESQWSDFPTTAGAYLPNAVIAGFLTKLSPTGALVYSTRLQAGGYAPTARSVAVNSAGEAFVTGKASDQGSWTPFVQQFSANGSALIYSKLVGGISLDEAYGISVDAASNAYITGQTFSADFPVTAGVVQPRCGVDEYNTCRADGFVARVGAAAGVPAPPGAPPGLAAVGTSRSQIALAWTAPDGAVDGYTVQRCTGGLAACNYSQGYLPIATVPGTSTGYIDVRLPSGMTYTYRVQAFNSGGMSSYSNADDGTTLAWAARRARTTTSGTATGTTERESIRKVPKAR